MEESIVRLARRITDQLESFLKACKAEGDTTIDDVLKRLDDLRKET